GSTRPRGESSTGPHLRLLQAAKFVRCQRRRRFGGANFGLLEIVESPRCGKSTGGAGFDFVPRRLAVNAGLISVSRLRVSGRVRALLARDDYAVRSGRRKANTDRTAHVCASQLSARPAGAVARQAVT
ncbi:MAG: hypothetical protein C5B48_08365, partial [Candidatus Rokuibacteriota bacterium]